MHAAAQSQLLADVEAFCQEIRPIEELCYVEHRFNDQLLPLARKHNILGMPVPESYGGRGADTVTYARALARIGREGTGVRTFFSGHTSIGEYPIMTWGNEDQKRRYLPAAVKGEKILAFGLTEPEAGSNPLEMQSTFTKQGDKYVLNGVKYLISNGGIAHAIVAFAYPAKRDGRISAFIADRDGNAGQRPHQRRRRLSRRHRGLSCGSNQLCQGTPPARQTDRQASAGPGTPRGHRDGPRRVGSAGDARRRG